MATENFCFNSLQTAYVILSSFLLSNSNVNLLLFCNYFPSFATLKSMRFSFMCFIKKHNCSKIWTPMVILWCHMFLTWWNYIHCFTIEKPYVCAEYESIVTTPYTQGGTRLACSHYTHLIVPIMESKHDSRGIVSSWTLCVYNQHFISIQ